MDKYGYNAIKTGYVGMILPKGEHHYSQSIVNHYQYVVDEAAKHKVMISEREVTCKDVLQMTMASGGGFAISFEEKR